MLVLTLLRASLIRTPDDGQSADVHFPACPQAARCAGQVFLRLTFNLDFTGKFARTDRPTLGVNTAQFFDSGARQ